MASSDEFSQLCLTLGRLSCLQILTLQGLSCLLVSVNKCSQSIGIMAIFQVDVRNKENSPIF